MTVDLRDAVFFCGLTVAAVGFWGMWQWPAALMWVGGVLVYKTLTG